MVTVLGIPFEPTRLFCEMAHKLRMRLMETECSANLFSECGSEIKNRIAYQNNGDLILVETKCDQRIFNNQMWHCERIKDLD